MTKSAPLPPLAFNAWLRYDLITRLFPDGITDALEIGCGRGGFGARLAQRARYVGLEPDAVSCEAAARALQRAGGRGDVRCGDLTCLGPDEQFDLVCAFEVLEHIEDHTHELASWVDRIRPGGWLMLSVPAHQARFASADKMAGHFRRYDPEALRGLLSDVGLVDIEVKLYGMPLGYLLEAGRNAIGRRRQRSQAGTSYAERTSASGRLLQPTGRVTGAVTQWGTLPFRWTQRLTPGAGVGLVARGRRPTADG